MWLLVLAGRTNTATLVLFAIPTLEDELQTFVAMVAILALAVVLDLAWKRLRDARAAGAAPGDSPLGT